VEREDVPTQTTSDSILYVPPLPTGLLAYMQKEQQSMETLIGVSGCLLETPSTTHTATSILQHEEETMRVLLRFISRR